MPSSAARMSTTCSGAATPVRTRARTSFSTWLTLRSQASRRPSGVNSAGRSLARSGSLASSSAIGWASSKPNISFAASGP
jgi:hypothetical protein